MSEPVLVSRRQGVLTLTLNRPERKNALSGEMIRRITTEVETAGSDDRARVIVIRATGPDFCSGIDLVESSRPDRGSAGPGSLGAPSPGAGSADGSGRPRSRAGHLQRGLAVGPHRMIQAITSVQLPVVAGVQGWAAGIGNALALSADVTIAATSAKFWVPFVTRGFTPDSGNSWLIPRLVGLARAKHMLMRGRPIAGPLAAEWGLVSECVDDDEMDNAIAAVTEELASLPTVAVGLTKVLTQANLESGFAAALQTEGIYEELGVRSDDFKEGMRAFAEKRDPSFTGW